MANAYDPSLGISRQQFDRLYLGEFWKNPTTNNIGGALIRGNLYLSLSLRKMQEYNGSKWLPFGLSSADDAMQAQIDSVTNLASDTANTVPDQGNQLNTLDTDLQALDVRVTALENPTP